jgi:hypothetical protein
VNKHTDAAIGADERSGEEHVDKHPHVHAFTHALATAGQAYANTVADLVTSHRPPDRQHALDEYERTHPHAHHDRPSDGGAAGNNGPRKPR